MPIIATENSLVFSAESPYHSSPPTLPRILIAFATIYLVWGSTYLAIRVAVQTMPPLLMASGRFVLAGAILALVLAMTRGWNASTKQWRDNFVIGAFMLLGGNGLVVWAEKEIPSGIATLVISLNPIFVVLAEWLIAAYVGQQRGSRPNWLTVAGLALGFLGLAVLVGPALYAQDASRLDPLRVLALVLACVSWTIGSLATRNLSQPAEPFTGAALQMLGGGVWLGVVGVACGELKHYSIADISLSSWLAWLYLLVAGSLIAFTTFVWLMKHVSPTTVSTYAYVNPIVAVFLGWLILDEVVGPRIFLATGIIVSGVALITYSKQRQAARTRLIAEAGAVPEQA